MSIKEIVRREFKLANYGQLRGKSPRLFRIVNRISTIQRTLKPVTYTQIARALK